MAAQPETAHTLIIAEVGVNHNGSLERALEMIDVAAEAGVDVVKFQTFDPKALVTATAPKAAYQKQQTGREESQLAMLESLQLSPGDYQVLLDRCKAREVEFLSTPFDEASLVLLVDGLGVKRLKVPSGEITNGPLLLAMARSGCSVILSTGMSTMAEVEEALQVLAFGMTDPKGKPSRGTFRKAWLHPESREILRERVVILHCTTEYPAPYEDVNLRAMGTLRMEFDLPVGLSDHTQGIAVPLAAVALGAEVIEKHFTLDRTLPGPDHAASLEPDELKAMITGIRVVDVAMGSPEKKPAPSEIPNIPVARKSLVAVRSISAGERFTADNLTAKRPGSGLSPMKYWEIIGTQAEREYASNEMIES